MEPREVARTLQDAISHLASEEHLAELELSPAIRDKVKRETKQMAKSLRAARRSVIGMSKRLKHLEW